MSFQGSINQLLGSASYYTSINPALREAQAERKNTQRALTAAKKADKALAAFGDTQLHSLSNVAREVPVSREAMKEDTAALTSYATAGGEALRARESALGQLFSQQPSSQTLNAYLGAQRARMEFEKEASASIQTRNEFMQFWKDLEDVIGPTGSNKAYEYYDKSTPVGGKK